MLLLGYFILVLSIYESEFSSNGEVAYRLKDNLFLKGLLGYFKHVFSLKSIVLVGYRCHMHHRTDVKVLYPFGCLLDPQEGAVVHKVSVFFRTELLAYELLIVFRDLLSVV